MNILPRRLRCRLVMMLVFFGLAGCEQGRVDAQMEKLCKQDGCITIFEKVTLSKEQFKYGAPIFFSTWNKVGGDYRFDSKLEQIKMNKPTHYIKLSTQFAEKLIIKY